MDKYVGADFSLGGISPNPASDQIQFSIDVNDNDIPLTVEIYNTLGQKVLTVMSEMTLPKGMSDIIIPLKADMFSSGVYLVRVSGGQTELDQQFLIMK